VRRRVLQRSVLKAAISAAAADRNRALDGLSDRPLLANSRFSVMEPAHPQRTLRFDANRNRRSSLGEINVVGLYWYFNHIRVRSFVLSGAPDGIKLRTRISLKSRYKIGGLGPILLNPTGQSMAAPLGYLRHQLVPLMPRHPLLQCRDT
jgi:hypothetical protein